MFAEARFAHKFAAEKRNHMRAIRVENPGPGYQLAVAEIPRPEPGPGEVLIKVAAAGLNRADIAQAMGHYPPPPGAPETLGMEVSGEIVETRTGRK
jgi:NADPH:quinone reductase